LSNIVNSILSANAVVFPPTKVNKLPVKGQHMRDIPSEIMKTAYIPASATVMGTSIGKLLYDYSQTQSVNFENLLCLGLGAGVLGLTFDTLKKRRMLTVTFSKDVDVEAGTIEESLLKKANISLANIKEDLRTEIYANPTKPQRFFSRPFHQVLAPLDAYMTAFTGTFHEALNERGKFYVLAHSQSELEDLCERVSPHLDERIPKIKYSPNPLFGYLPLIIYTKKEHFSHVRKISKKTPVRFITEGRTPLFFENVAQETTKIQHDISCKLFAANVGRQFAKQPFADALSADAVLHYHGFDCIHQGSTGFYEYYLNSLDWQYTNKATRVKDYFDHHTKKWKIDGRDLFYEENLTRMMLEYQALEMVNSRISERARMFI